MSDKPKITLPGTVEKIINPVSANEPEKAQIAVDRADDLYKEIRIENTLTKSGGEKVGLKPGAEVEVTIEAPARRRSQRQSTELISKKAGIIRAFILVLS